MRGGLRTRLVIAFVAVALLGALVTTVYSSLSLTARLETSAEARLQNSALHFGEVAAVVSDGSGWSRQSIETLHHLAQIDTLAARLYDVRGELVFEHPASGPVEPGAAASSPVMAGERRIGRVDISRDDGRLFTEEEIRLRSQLLRTNLIAGVTSAAIALAVALYLAVTLSRPLRHIRAGAEAMGAGDLETRVPESGDDEIAAVAAALNRLAETLQQEEALRKESVADLAHELRTPVMGVLARVEAAQDGVLEDDAANLSAMHDEALRLSRLLDDLSALAEAERPGLLLDAEPVDLAAIARAQTAAFAGAFAEKGIGAGDGPPAGAGERRAQAPRAGRREPALQRAALHGRRGSRARHRASRRPEPPSSRCPTPASASPRRTCRASSPASGAARSRAHGTPAARASGCRSSRSSCRRTAARSAWRARRGGDPCSASRCRCRRGRPSDAAGLHTFSTSGCDTASGDGEPLPKAPRRTGARTTPPPPSRASPSPTARGRSPGGPAPPLSGEHGDARWTARGGADSVR